MELSVNLKDNMYNINPISSLLQLVVDMVQCPLIVCGTVGSILHDGHTEPFPIPTNASQMT